MVTQCKVRWFELVLREATLVLSQVGVNVLDHGMGLVTNNYEEFG